MVKYLALPGIIFLFLSCTSHEQPLFKIIKEDKVGYINSKGVIIIKPSYLNGYEFSDGLAAVRENGLFGFIDENGEFKISPRFDYATSFIDGIAGVYKNGQPYLIDKSGNTVLPAGYVAINLVANKKAFIKTQSGKIGLIDLTSNRILIDTIFSSISNFKNGVAIAREYIRHLNKAADERTAVIDSTGKFVVPFGKYKTISPFIEGYAKVEIGKDEKDKDEEDIQAVIDCKGNLAFKKSFKNNLFIDGDFHNGFAKISLYKYWIPEEKGVSFTTEKAYEGYVNLKGEVVFDDTAYRYAYDFSNSRAFIKDFNNKYHLINTNFKEVSKLPFSGVLNDTFSNGYAIVESEGGWGIIDTFGKFVTKPQYDEIDRIGIVGHYFFYAVDSDGNDENKLYGIADLKGDTIVKPFLEDFDRVGFVNGLIKTIVKGRLTYINTKGNVIWQESADQPRNLKKLNIDFMNRGYFYAYSSPKKAGGDDSGGWFVSKNTPFKIDTSLHVSKSELSVIIDINKKDTFEKVFCGYSLYVANTTNDIAQFNAQDSRLYMKLQAKDKKGEWRDIEYLPSSWCGNSYHKISLGPNTYWKFTIPDYCGEFKTKIRAKLQYVDKSDPKKSNLIYSNEIDGSVNPAQFWNKRAYYPSGLMDPYND